VSRTIEATDAIKPRVPMKRLLKFSFITLTVLLTVVAIAAAAAFAWHARSKLPQRSGTLALQHLQSPVSVTYDERGVPHIRAQHEADLYRALGYVHAQDRLFQMEMVRRLARGELAEIIGPKLLDTDRLFRTLGLRAHAETVVASADQSRPAWQALAAYLDGINQYQASRPLPLEFEILGIQPRPFTAVDTIAMTGYLSYSFAAAFRTEPVLTFVRDQLGPAYLKAFDLEWHPLGVVGPLAETALMARHATRLTPADWQGLNQLARLSDEALTLAGLPQFEGSNAWVISGQHTASGKPLLAGDPHISFSSPAVWYEAHLMAPGFELYGHHQALNPVALLGHNSQFGWSLTMFQNDDLDLIAEKVNPANPNQVWHQGQWVDLQSRTETIAVKGAAPVTLTLRRSPHGPIINDAFADSLGKTPIAMWWAWSETENLTLDAFYELNRADTRAKARAASSKIHAPGLNIVWANAAGDIGWWAAAKLPQRPEGVNPAFILDGANGEADKPGFYRFQDNPQEENPARGYIVSANHQPAPTSGLPVPGYYNLYERAQRLDQLLREPLVKWDLPQNQALQLDTRTAYGPRVLQPLLPELRTVVIDAAERALLEQLAEWDGSYGTTSIAPTLFQQFVYELAKAAMADELGEVPFGNLLRTRAFDFALPRLAADAASPWWDQRGTPAVEKRRDILQLAWRATIAHLESTLGKTPASWVWGKAHTLTHNHPLGQQKPLNLLFNTGPFEAPGGREVLNNLSTSVGPVPWAVVYGPSTRRVIDFADAAKGLGINPVGQSGVLFDPHHHDQAAAYVAGQYQPMFLSPGDVAAHTRSTLTLLPQR
jgi:penicillin G amidase